MRFASFAELPVSARCNKCGVTKPLAQMMVARSRRDSTINVRPRCKACQSEFERGHRREWKRAYCRRWREQHPGAWRDKQDRARNTRNMKRWRTKHLAAYRMQARMRKRGWHLDWRSAGELLRDYGPAYPLASGLNAAGRREMERLRAQARRRGTPLHNWQLAMQAWERKEFRLPKAQQPQCNESRRNTIVAYWASRRFCA